MSSLSLRHMRIQTEAGRLQAEETHRNISSSLLNLAFLSFRIMRKNCLLLRPHRSRHFIIAVLAGYDSKHIREPAKVTLENYSFSPVNNLAGLAPCPLA